MKKNLIETLLEKEEICELVSSSKPLEIAAILVKDFSIQPEDACKKAIDLVAKAKQLKEFGPETGGNYPISKRFRFNSEKNHDHIDEKQRFEKEKGEKYQPGILKKLYDDYGKRGDIFLFAHFANELPDSGGQIKLGINPRSDPKVSQRAGHRTATFNTPLGIYSYPVVMFPKDDIQKGSVPFAGDRKYIALFSVKNAYKNKIIVIDDSGDVESSEGGMKNAEVLNILDRLETEHPKEYQEGKETTKLRTPLGMIWNITRLMAKESPSVWAKTLKSLGIMGVIDLGSGIIHQNEPNQAVFFGKEVIEILGVDNTQKRFSRAGSSVKAAEMAKTSEDPKVLRQLVKTKDTGIWFAIAGNPAAPSDVLSDMAKQSGDKYILNYIVRNPNASPELLRDLAKDKAMYVREGAAKNPNTPLDVLEVLIADKQTEVKNAAIDALAKRDIKPDDLMRLAKSENTSVRTTITRHPNTTPEVFRVLAKDEDVGVRLLVAIKSRDEIALKSLLNDKEEGVSMYAKKSLGKLGDKEKNDDRIKRYRFVDENSTLREADEDSVSSRWRRAENPNATPEALTKLAGDENDRVRQLVARHLNTPSEVLTKLAEDKHWMVRQSVTQNPNTPPEVLTKLAEDENEGVRREVAENPNTPPELLRDLAKDKATYVRKGVTESPNTPPELLRDLAKDKVTYVRKGVAQNPNTPPEVLTKLAEDESEDVRVAVAENPNATPEALTKLAEDEDWMVSELVAQHPNIPPEVLTRLAEDESEGIRRSVAKNPNATPEVLTRLAEDESKHVRQAVAENPNATPEMLRTIRRAVFKKNVQQQKVSKVQKHILDQVFDQIDDFLDKKGVKREYSWADFSGSVKYNSQPKGVKELLNRLNKNGRVYKDDVLKLSNHLSHKIYGISYSQYDGIQTLFDEGVQVIQVNITEELDEQLQEDEEFYDFFKKVSDTSFQSSHPVVKDLTIGWMRYYEVSNDTWLIEEVQTDILYAIKNKQVLQDVFGGNIAKQKEFLKKAEEFFGEWERALINHLKDLALKKSVQHIYMVSDVIKGRTANLHGTTKLKTIYEKLPLQVGFKKISFDDMAKYNKAIQTQMKPNEHIWYARTSSIKESRKRKIETIKRYKFSEASHSTKQDFTPRDQQIINRWEFPPDPIKKQNNWPYSHGQINAMDPKSKSRKMGFGGMIAAAKKPKADKDAFHQIKFPNGKKIKAPGGDYGGSQGVQSKDLPHAQDNPDSVGNVIGTNGSPGWSKSLPNREFEPPVNNFGDKEKNDDRIKRYRFVDESKVIYEISEDEIDKISDYLEDSGKLSFNNIFGDKHRVMIPLHSEEAESEIQELINFLKDNGYEPDFATGTAEKEFEIPAGPKKGQKQKRKEKIGKIISKLNSLYAAYDKSYGTEKGKKDWDNIVKNYPDVAKKYEEDEEDFIEIDRAKKLEKFWNEKSEFYRKNPEALEGDTKSKYQIIVSRHPVDVLRMSDFSNIRSCHSVGNSFYKCAVAEAKGHGLVAYVVETSRLPKDFDIDDDEVFTDRERGISGVEPIARIRLRKYVHNDTGEELAVPEQRTYGRAPPGLKDEITKWAREAQKLDTSNPPNMSDYTRYGGSYSDNTDGALFNNLFDSEDYRGNTKIDTASEDEEDENLAEEWENECEAIEESFDRRAEHSNVWYDIDDDGDGPYISYSAGITVELDILKAYDLDLDNVDIDRIIAELTPEFYFEHGEQDRVNWISFAIANEDEPLEPVGFRNFAEWVLDGYDKKYEKLQGKIVDALVHLEYIDLGEVYTTLKKNAEEDPDYYENFALSVNEDGPGEIGVDLDSEKHIEVSFGGYGKQFLKHLRGDSFKDFIKSALVEYYGKYGKNTQLELPGLETERYETDLEGIKQQMGVDTNNLSTAKEEVFSVWFGFSITPDLDDDTIRSILDFCKFYDKQYDRLSMLIGKIYQQYLKAGNIITTKKSLKINLSIIAEIFGKIMSKISDSLANLQRSNDELVQSLKNLRDVVEFEYIIIDETSVLLRGIDFSFLIEFFDASLETGNDFMKSIFYNLYKACLVSFKEKIQSQTPSLKKFENLYVAIDKNAFENMPINLKVNGPTLVAAMNKWRAEPLSDEDLDTIQDTLDGEKIDKKDVMYMSAMNLKERKVVKRYRFMEVEDNLMDVPEREKPPKVGTPAPAMGRSGGMDPLRKSGRKI